MSNPVQPDGALVGKTILLGVTGSIAAYKAAELIRLLKKAGASVQVLATESSAHFIPPLTLATLSGNPVLTKIFPESGQSHSTWTQHITLGIDSDLFVIAPATAQTIAQLTHGFSDSMITATALAARCPLLVCPAMDHDMYVHPATQANLKRLRTFGYEIMSPEHGELASGLIGEGRLPEPEAIFARIVEQLTEEKPLAGTSVLVTAGPTREAIDPVRFLSNPSTGTMGFAIAKAARQKGADVILVAGPTHLSTPTGVTRIDVSSAADMFDAVQKHRDADYVFMAAAVADYRPATQADHKIKKGGEALPLQLERTQDILLSLGQNKPKHQCLVGFALETQNGLENAQAKLEKKNLDWIVLNSPNKKGEGFGTTTNRVTLLSPHHDPLPFPLQAKAEVAMALLDHILLHPS